jgi:hypothetical protein
MSQKLYYIFVQLVVIKSSVTEEQFDSRAKWYSTDKITNVDKLFWEASIN